MRTKTLVVFLVLMLVGSLPVSAEPHNSTSLDFAFAETGVEVISWGTGFPPEPGGKIRGLTLLYEVSTTGPGAEFWDGFEATIVINANLDESYSGPAWGTFEYSSEDGSMTWVGTWSGQFNWMYGVGSWKFEGHGQGDALKGLEATATAVAVGDGGDYVFGTIKGKLKD